MWIKMTRYAGFTLCLLLLMTLLAGQSVQAGSVNEAGEGGVAAAVPHLITSTTSSTAMPRAATVTVELCAKAGTVTMPDAAVVGIWGYALKPSGVPCSDSSVVAGLPGPVLEANVGDTLNITLYNELSEASSLVFPGQAGAPDLTGVTGGSSTIYSFVASEPGTFLYESGVNTERQVPMGLYGALVVHAAPGMAYGTAASAYDAAAVLVLSELDPAFNADPGGFDLLDYAPKYWLINGQAFPDTANIGVNSNARVLLRYVNAGLIHHSMSLLGLYQTVVGEDGYAESFPYELMVPSIPSGQTLDTIVTVPNGTVGQQYPLYNRHMALTNVASFPGGMMTYLEITGTGGPSNVPPLVNAGGDQVVTMPAAAALDGTVTDDGLLAPYTVLWTASGPGPVTFGNAAAEDTTASFTTSGVYVLTLTADDGQYQVGDSVTITVNQPPAVNAGPDQAITLPSGANLNGTVTDDGLLVPYAVLWTGVGPGTVTFGNATLEDTTATFSAAGSYLLTLTANDGQYIVSDNVVITVNPTPANTMHVGSMTGFRFLVIRSVTITVHNGSHGVLSGVTVSGSWSGGTGGSSSCTTNVSGQCTVTRNSFGSPSYTVNNLTRAGWTYSSASNHPNPPTYTP